MTNLGVRSSEDEVLFAVRVQPRATRDLIDGVRDGALRIRLTSPPVEGEANDALARFLAARLQVPKSAVRILSGERGSLKRVAVRGTTATAVQALVSEEAF